MKRRRRRRRIHRCSRSAHDNKSFPAGAAQQTNFGVAADTTKAMKITLEHVSDGEVFPNNVILLRGSVSLVKEDWKTIYIEHNSSGKVIRNLSTQCGPDAKFKILVKLGLGTNELSVQYLSAVETISVLHLPPKNQNKIKLLYIVCKDSDGRFQAPPDMANDAGAACARISLGVSLVQCFISDSLEAQGLGRKTFSVDLDHNGVPACEIFISGMTIDEAHQLSGLELWTFHAKELLERLDDAEDTKYLAIMASTRYANPFSTEPSNYDRILSLTKGHAAIGGGGLALFGSACLYTWPETLDDVQSKFQDQTPVDWKHFMDDSAYRHTHGACFATSLGAVIHELGHSLDLVHSDEGIMARGFDDINVYFLANTVSSELSSPTMTTTTGGGGAVVANVASSTLKGTTTTSCSRRTARRPKLSFCSNHEKLPDEEEADDDDGSKPKFTSIGIRTRGQELLDGYHERKFYARLKKEFGGAFWCRSHALILDSHKWLNPGQAADETTNSKLRMDPGSGLIESSSGIISLVEFRNKYNVTLTSFQPISPVFDAREKLQELPNVKEIFAINEFGRMLKVSASSIFTD